MGNEISSGRNTDYQLSPFRREKLMHEFNTFFDVNKSGGLEWKDFDMTRKKICDLSGWESNSEDSLRASSIFHTVWENLQEQADENNDGKITAEEWIKMWTKWAAPRVKMTDKIKSKKQPEVTLSRLPAWLEKYVEYRFSLYDRTRDGIIDIEEFEYVLSDFNVSAKNARAAFIIFSKNQEKQVNLEYFKQLSCQYFQSEEPSDLGNFITGKLDFL